MKRHFSSLAGHSRAPRLLGDGGASEVGEAPQRELWIHVPFPGDHYSPATGSAAMAVVYELNRQHEKNGGMARVVVGRGTRHDYAVDQCVEVPYGISPHPAQKAIDTVLGRLRLPRQVEASIYRPASRAISAAFDGPIFVINAPGALATFKDTHRRAQVCLYAVNALFRTYNRAEVRRTLRQADRVICCSQYIANDLEMRLGKASPQIQVVHHGIDTEKFQPLPANQAENARETENEVPTILFVGRAVPEKGPDLLLRAVCRIHQGRGAKGRKFKVRIVGSAGYVAKRRLTAYEAELRRLAAPLGDAVEFHASVNREQLLREYQSASIFCAPSNWDDPFPLTVLEAMSCGLPVVASRRGGIPEGGGDAIQYFSPPDVEELAAQLAALVDSAPLRANWGARARQHIQSFAWANQYRVLRQALDLPPSPAISSAQGTATASTASEIAAHLKINGLNLLGWLVITGWLV